MKSSHDAPIIHALKCLATFFSRSRVDAAISAALSATFELENKYEPSKELIFELWPSI